jgi:hypothetical protein
MSRELLKQALYALKYHSIQTRPIDLTDETIEALRQELAKPEPIYVMGNYVGEGKVVSASFGLPKGAFEFAPYTGAGEASKIKHSIEPEQEPVAKHVCNLWINPKTSEYEVDRCTHPISEVIPVYTAPPRKEWVGLTNEDWENTPDTGKQGCERDAELFDWIEQTLKDKNEPSR